MTQTDRELLIEARALVGQFRDLGGLRAPPTLLAAVQQRLGLDDAYATFDTPLGLAFIAFAAAGIRMVDVGVSPDDFAAAYRARFGRPIRRLSELPDSLARSLQDWAIGCVPARLRFDLSELTEFEQAVLR